MKDLKLFCDSYIYEAGKKSNNAVTKDADDLSLKDLGKKVTVDGKAVPASKVKQVKPGVSANKNGSHGTFAVEPPLGQDSDGQQWTLLDKKHMTRNQRKLASRFNTRTDFMVMGEAGWGKTAEITAMAHKFGYTVITVYLDKAVATDLDGLPTPVKTGNNRGRVEKLMPEWAAYMVDNSDTKFLLFFDEMNQAQPDVQNALMPIVLKHVICNTKFDNIICGAAGNLQHENEEGVFELSGPLKSRLHPFIWEVNTQDCWESHFNWAHKNYDSLLGDKFIDTVAKYRQLWKSPRDITRGIYDYAVRNIESGHFFDEPEDIAEQLIENIISPKVNPNEATVKKSIDEFVDYLYAYISDGGLAGEEKAKNNRRRRTLENVDPDIIKIIKNSLKLGYYRLQCDNKMKDTILKARPDVQKCFSGNYLKLLVTADNILTGVFNPEETGVNAEMLEKIIDNLNDSGSKVKFMSENDAKQFAKENNLAIPSEIDAIVS